MKNKKIMKQLILAFLCCTSFSIVAQTPYDSFASTKASKQLGSETSQEFKVSKTELNSKSITYDKENSSVRIYNNSNLLQTSSLSPMNTKFISVDPMADKYPGWGAYVYCINNPLTYIDPTGEYFVDKDGNQISHSNGKLGDNASDDLKLVQSGMNYSETGKQQFNKMADAKHPIHIEINKSESVTTKNDGIQNGMTNPKMIVDKADPNKVDFSKTRPTTITLNESSIMASTKDGKSNEGLPFAAALGITAVHESLHATDKDNLNDAKDAKDEANALHGGKMTDKLEETFENEADELEEKARLETIISILNGEF